MSEPILLDSARGSELKRYVREEQVRLPRELLERSQVRALFQAAAPYLLVSLVVIGARAAPPGQSVWVLLLAFVPILAAQRCIQTTVHDLSHSLYSPRRATNDWLGNWFTAGLIGMRIESYRTVHFVHHAENGNDADPEYFDYEAVREKGGLLAYVLRYALLLEAFPLISKYYLNRGKQPERGAPGSPGSEPGFVASKLHIGAAQLALLAVFVFVAGEPALYAVWLYTALTWSPLLSRLRFVVEHPGRDDRTVTTLASWPERLFFAPFGFNYHFEHHLWPSVPPYNLRRTHEFMGERGFFRRHPQYLNDSYLGSLGRSASR
jgi:fatty acid desaturase